MSVSQSVSQLALLKQNVRITYHETIQFLILQHDIAEEVQCNCLPISVVERDIEDKKNPLGSADEQCFQVESNLVFEEKDVNGKVIKHIKLKL